MLIRIGYDIELGLTGPTALVTLLRVHPDREADLTAPERPTIVPGLHVDRYTDLYGNTCERYQVPAGVTRVRLQHSATVRDTGQPDPVVPDAVQHPVDQLPPDTLLYLLASRYCEVDSELMTFAWDTFGATAPRRPAGRGCRRCATGCTGTCGSTTCRPTPHGRPSAASVAAWVSAGTSRTWP